MKNRIPLYFLFGLACFSCVNNPLHSQNTESYPLHVTIKDTIFLNTINKYQQFLSSQESMIVGIEKRSDTTKYYISAIRSLYELSNNIPVVYAKIDNRFVFLYSGLESIIQLNNEKKDAFLKKTNTALFNDILPDRSQNTTSRSALYDPFQVKLTIKNGKRVSEDYKTGFGARGFPYFMK